MNYDTLRVYETGRFRDIDLPDWYREAERLCEAERLDWHLALERALGCDNIPLTEEGAAAGGIEVHFWPSSTHGIFVLIAAEAGLIEHVLVTSPIDWLPFLTTYIVPLIAANAQLDMAAPVHKLTNAFIAFARHGEGTHVDRWSGLSRIDRENDDQVVKDMIMRAELKRRLEEDRP